MNNKLQLYNNIMKNISKEIKLILNEDIQNFNPVDYEDDAHDIINQDTISNLTSYHPKDRDELKNIIIKKINKAPFIDGVCVPDFSDIDISYINDLTGVFNGDVIEQTNLGYKFLKIDITNWNTSNVTNMWGMFECNKNVTYIDMSGIDLSSIENMRYMFDGCEKLKKLNIDNVYVTGEVGVIMMFRNCKSLTRLNLSNFKITPESLYGMLYNCIKLEYVDLSGINPEQLTCKDDISYFGNSRALKHIILPEELVKKILFNCRNVNIDIV